MTLARICRKASKEVGRRGRREEEAGVGAGQGVGGRDGAGAQD